MTRSGRTRAADADVYELGPEHWNPGWLPDFRSAKERVALADNQMIDVVILGDGYETAAQFEEQLDAWLADFHALDVYSRFRGAFRLRAVFTDSPEPASLARGSHYGVKADDDGVSDDGWWRGSSTRSREFRRRLFESVDRLTVNRRRYPTSLDVGGADTVIHNGLARMYSNLVVAMLVRTASRPNTSGRTRDVPAPGGARVNVAFGALALHEFGHAFAYLEDEYIGGRDRTASRRNPSLPSIFTLSNLSFSDRLEDVLWLHLSPWGTVPRTAAGAAPSPIVGWLWLGGEAGKRVWHSEYQCLMNGQHENYLFTPVAADDGVFTEGAKVSLRSRDRFCFWCEEIVAARVLEKTGQLAAPGDPAGVNARGRRWHDHWISIWRVLYWSSADLSSRMSAREAFYADAPNFPLLESNGLQLERSGLLQPFRSAGGGAGAPPGSEDEEASLLLVQ